MTKQTDVQRLEAALRALDASSREGPLPDPGLILRKARLLARLEARDRDLARATRPLRLASAGVLAGAGGLLAWSGWWAAAPLLAGVALVGGLRLVWETE
jgi:hypothetical protein